MKIKPKPITDQSFYHDDGPKTEPLTLWQMLRKHGVGLYAAQMICNDVMLNGVRIPSSPQESDNG